MTQHSSVPSDLDQIVARLDMRLQRRRQTTGYRKASSHVGAHAPGLLEDFYDFDTQVLSPGGVADVCARYLAAMEPCRAARDISYLAFIDKDRGLTTGAILLAGALAEKAGLPYALVYPDKEIERERVKWPGLRDPVGTLKGETGILVTDHVSHGDEVIRACDALKNRGGTICLIIAFSAYGDRVRARHGAYLERSGIDFKFFNACPQVDLADTGTAQHT